MNLAQRWYYDGKLNLSQVAIGDKGEFRRGRTHERPTRLLKYDHRPPSHDICMAIEHVGDLSTS
jgi:hypothetical protein